MKQRLKTNNLFLDTSIFESENFLEGLKLQTLFELAGEGIVIIIMPEITYLEIIARMKRQLAKAKDYIDSIKTPYKSLARVVRNVDHLKALAPLPGINIKKDLANMQEKFDRMLKAVGVIRLGTEGVSIENVFIKYFEGQYPFHQSNKKNEFPDAFALAAIESWCVANNQQCYVLSLDKDMLNYEAESLIPVNDIANIIDSIQRDKHHRSVSLIDEIMQRERLSILYEAKDKIEALLFEAGEELVYDSGFEVQQVQDIKMSEVTLTDYQIIEMTSTKAIVECACRFNFVVQVVGEDYSESIYDNEDQKYLNVQNVTNTLSGKMEVPLHLMVAHGVLRDGQAVFIDEINDDYPIDLSEFQ